MSGSSSGGRCIAVQDFGDKDRLVHIQASDLKHGRLRQQPMGNKGASKEIKHSLEQFMFKFLPVGYPASVAPSYLPYVKWQLAVGMLSSASGVLSTQSLLFAIGLGASTAIPAAAALNWVVKDGLGQLGGMLFANFVSDRFDADPKRFRMLAAYSLDAAVFVEMCTPFVPHLFLPLASLANVSKNISWLAASSTRAGIHRTFIRHENLADITAKAGSQTIGACLAGTGLGIILSTQAAGDPFILFSMFTVLSVGHLFANHRSLVKVALSTLNAQRMFLLETHFLQTHKVCTPDELRLKESFLNPFGFCPHLDRSSRYQAWI